MTVNALFSRLVPFYLLPTDEADDSLGFDAYPVEVDARTLAIAVALRSAAGEMNDFFDTQPAPEEAAQQSAAHFEELLTEIIDAFNA